MILSYCRVSTQEQAADGSTSLAEQERKNRAVASIRNAGKFDFVNYVDAGVSGSVPLADRPQGGKMLKDAAAGDVICATKLDRLFRSATDALHTLEDLKNHFVDLILIDLGVEPVTGRGVGKLVFGVLSMVAEFERERIAERMTDGRTAKRARGGHIGGDAPYGYTVQGSGRQATLVPDPNESQVLDIVRSYRARNPYTILKEFKQRGIVSRSGKPFQMVQVQRMIAQVSQ